VVGDRGRTGAGREGCSRPIRGSAGIAQAGSPADDCSGCGVASGWHARAVRWRRYPNRRLSLPARSKTLPGIARAVGDQVEVVLDGGVRRGDVAKALALGAKAVMIGRAYLWGLAANGQAGVENVLDLLHAGLDSALLGLGHSSVSDIPADPVIPGGFTRRLSD
jgi:FMN-dependent dehydrogenase